MKIPGHFRSLAGSLKITPDGATGVLEIDAASLDTRNRLRDRHLRSPGLLCRGRAPAASLRAALARPGWAREAPARGSAHGRWRPTALPLDADLWVLSEATIEISARTQVDRLALGLHGARGIRQRAADRVR